MCALFSSRHVIKGVMIIPKLNNHILLEFHSPQYIPRPSFHQVPKPRLILNLRKRIYENIMFPLQLCDC